jgi:hypothetical protein
VTFDALDDVLGVLHRCAHAAGADDDVAAFRQQDHARGLDFIVVVGDGNRRAAFVELSQRGEGGTEVDSNGVPRLEFHRFGH